MEENWEEICIWVYEENSYQGIPLNERWICVGRCSVKIGWNMRIGLKDRDLTLNWDIDLQPSTSRGGRDRRSGRCQARRVSVMRQDINPRSWGSRSIVITRQQFRHSDIKDRKEYWKIIWLHNLALLPGLYDNKGKPQTYKRSGDRSKK